MRNALRALAIYTSRFEGVALLTGFLGSR